MYVKNKLKCRKTQIMLGLLIFKIQNMLMLGLLTFKIQTLKKIVWERDGVQMVNYYNNDFIISCKNK